jgi:hypothetical protein
MKKKIVILENSWTDYKKIRSYFPGYDYYPDVQDLKGLAEFLQDIKDALNDKLPEQDRKIKKENVISLFQENCRDAFAYIIDYELKEGNNALTGLAFHNLFILGEYKKIYADKEMPCIMPTKMTGNKLLCIDEYANKINNRSLFSFTYKPTQNEDDTKYRRILQDFVENAYPRVRLAKYIDCKIAFNYNNNEIENILKDIINNPDAYKDDIDDILSNCINFESNRDKKYTEQLINRLKGAKNA